MHRLLKAPELSPWIQRHGRERVRAIAAGELSRWRRLLNGARGEAVPPVSPAQVVAAVLQALVRETAPPLRRVINASGVVLHTGLGRAPLAPEALAAMVGVATGYSNLEFDLETGERGQRSAAVAPLLRTLVGAEATLVVNNNAGAVLLALTALASGREVVVSRGELVEIGGGFRIPEVLAQSGARLREVGTTNRTHLRDYETAIGPDTALLLLVHPSNFRLVGFTAAPDLAGLVALARARGIPLLYDLGSGHLDLDLGTGSPPQTDDGGEPGVRWALRMGADLVTFSGDKLLGGPQAGLACGSAELVGRLARHPLQRALRVDKLTLAALHATLDLYARGVAGERIPAARMLATTASALQARAVALAASLERALGAGAATIGVEVSESEAGAGALAARGLPTWVVTLGAPACGANRLHAQLRRGDPPVIARLQRDRVLFDPRTLAPEDIEALPDLVRAALTAPAHPA